MNSRYSTDTDTQVLAGYEAGRTAAALHDESNYGRLWLSGEDRVPFLQRLTTNDMHLAVGQGTVTVLTSPTARILAVFTVLAMQDGLLLLAGPEQGPAAYNALRSQIFFADRVTVEGRGAALAQFGLYGPEASNVLERVADQDKTLQDAPSLGDLPLFAWRRISVAGVEVTVQRNEGLGQPGFTLLAPAPAGAMVQAALLTAGAVPLPEPAYHILRVEAGIPAPGFELTDQVNPLEADLRRFCDDHKGCYTGQEVIARQITYDKVTTHLVGLLPEEAVAQGDTIEVGSRQVGFVSSAVHSLALNRPIALAFVRRPHHQPGTVVSIRHTDEEVAAEVTVLPFVGQ